MTAWVVLIGLVIFIGSVIIGLNLRWIREGSARPPKDASAVDGKQVETPPPHSSTPQNPASYSSASHNSQPRDQVQTEPPLRPTVQPPTVPQDEPNLSGQTPASQIFTRQPLQTVHDKAVDTLSRPPEPTKAKPARQEPVSFDMTDKDYRSVLRKLSSCQDQQDETPVQEELPGKNNDDVYREGLRLMMDPERR